MKKVTAMMKDQLGGITEEKRKITNKNVFAPEG